jgi:hypothetical protein
MVNALQRLIMRGIYLISLEFAHANERLNVESSSPQRKSLILA